MRAHVIYCEDIRREDTGKFFIIGVLMGSMVVKKAHDDVIEPFRLDISTWIEIHGLEVGEYDITSDMYFWADGEKELVGRLEWPQKVNDPDSPIIATPSALDFEIPKSGTIVTSISIDGEEIPTIGTLKIRLSD